MSDTGGGAGGAGERGEERQDFQRAVERISLRIWTYLGLGFVAVLLAWWPMDAALYGDRPGWRAGMGQMRAGRSR